MRKVKWILFGLILVILLVVVFRNLEETQVELIVTTVKLPLAALLMVTLLIGFAMGMFASALWKVRNWRAQARARKDPAPVKQK